MILIFDVSNIAYASYHALHGQISNPLSATIFGLIRSITARATAAAMYQHVLLAFDDVDNRKPIPTWRHELYPDYKKSRKKKDDESRAVVFKAIEELKGMCPYLPLHYVSAPDTEADDMIAKAAHHYRHSKVPVQIVSGDKDMHQLIDPYVEVYVHSKEFLATTYNFHEAHYVKDSKKVKTHISTPNDWLAFRVLSGDSSDDITGVPNKFGPLSAAKTVASARNILGSEHNSCADFLKYIVENSADVMSRGGVRGWKKHYHTFQTPEVEYIINRNLNLMCLHENWFSMREQTPDVFKHTQKGTLDRDRINLWYQNHQFNSILEKSYVWDDMAIRSGA